MLGIINVLVRISNEAAEIIINDEDSSVKVNNIIFRNDENVNSDSKEDKNNETGNDDEHEKQTISELKQSCNIEEVQQLHTISVLHALRDIVALISCEVSNSSLITI